MKKRDLTTLAMIGISAGLMLGGCETNTGVPGSGNLNKNSLGNNTTAEQMSPDLQAFYSSLSSDAQKKFIQLDAQHKMMAVEMANQSCNGKNKCSGMGGCSTTQHQCAGKNSCKGQGGAPVKDPNKAVELQYNNQTNQRQKANGGMGGSGSTSTQSGSSQSNSSTDTNDESSS